MTKNSHKVSLYYPISPTEVSFRVLNVMIHDKQVLHA